jgi:hypothetical protein
VKFFAVALLVGALGLSAVRAEEPRPSDPIESPQHSYLILQHYWIKKGWSARVGFVNPSYAKVRLMPRGLLWPAIYDISPDEHWILRIQKMESGENIGILYSVVDGHVTEVLGFNDKLWKAAEPKIRRPFTNFSHVGIVSAGWDQSSERLTVHLRGEPAEGGSGTADVTISCEPKSDCECRLVTTDSQK